MRKKSSGSVNRIDVDADTPEGEKFLEFLEGLGAKVSGECEHRESMGKMIDSAPMLRSWKENWKNLKKQKDVCAHLSDNLEKAEEKLKTLRARFWSEIEIDLDSFDTNMKYNEEDDVIEVYE